MAKYVALIDGMDSASAADLSGWAEAIFSSEGVFAIGGELAVSESDTPGMSVKVQDGQCLVLRDAYVDNDNTQKFWHVIVTADEDVTIDNNSSGSTRIDRICVKIDTAAVPDANASNVATLVAVKGTPGAGAPTVPDNHVLLAQVSVEDSETTILDADITDERTYLSVGIPELDITSATGNITVAGSDPWRTITLKPGFMKPTNTSGCAGVAQSETSTNKINYDTLDFDTSSEEHAYAIFSMPDSWDAGVIQFRVKWTAASGSGGVAWGLAGRSYADDDALDQAVGTEVVVTDTLITAADVHQTAWSGDVTLAGTPAAGEEIYLELARVVANGSDTLGVDAKLISLQIRFKQAQFTD